MRPDTPGALVRLVLLALALGASGARGQQGREAQLEALRDISEGQPMRVEDAAPSEPGPQAEVSLLTSDETGEDGLQVQPQLSLGLPSKTEVGLQASAGWLEGQTKLGPLEPYVLQQLLPEGTLWPQVGLKLRAATPTQEVGWAAQLGLLTTKTLGEARVHARASWRPQLEAEDRFFLGVGADHPVGSRVLLVGNVYREWLGDAQATSLAGQAGASFLLGEKLRLHSVLGLQRVGRDVDPFLQVGFSAG